MFLSDEVRAEASLTAAAGRLAALASGPAFTQASRAAWDVAAAAAGPVGTLTAVRCRAPARRGAAVTLTLRWEAADAAGRPFPALDADITVIPDGEHAVLIGLAGVYRTAPGTRPARPAADLAAATGIRALLTRIAAAVSDAAAPVTDATAAG